MNVIKSFLNSEKGVFAYLLPMIGVTVLAALSKISAQQWVEYAILFSGIYTGGKAIQGAGAAIGDGKAAKAEIEVLKAKLASNDAAADKALAEKFKEE